MKQKKMKTKPKTCVWIHDELNEQISMADIGCIMPIPREQKIDIPLKNNSCDFTPIFHIYSDAEIGKSLAAQAVMPDVENLAEIYENQKKRF